MRSLADQSEEIAHCRKVAGVWENIDGIRDEQDALDNFEAEQETLEEGAE